MKLKERLNSKEQVMGTMVTTFSNPDIMKLLKGSGFDFCVIDCEHSAFTYSECGVMISVARGIGFPVIVRVPELKREPVLKFIEMGATGLLLPSAETKEQAQGLVEFAKYAPLGKRGVSLSRPHTDFEKVNGRAYMDRANEETILMCQIESCLGVENIEEIIGVAGIDVAFIGPNDMSQDYGILGEFENPIMIKAFAKIQKAAEQAGKCVGIHFGSKAPLAKWVQNGMQMNMCGSDVSLIQLGAKEILK